MEEENGRCHGEEGRASSAPTRSRSTPRAFDAQRRHDPGSDEARQEREPAVAPTWRTHRQPDRLGGWPPSMHRLRVRRSSRCRQQDGDLALAWLRREQSVPTSTRSSTPSSRRPWPGCEECLKIGGSWMHLRMCLSCGKIGCCDNSPNRHATAHFQESAHPLIRSAEAHEDWYWCYVDEVGWQPGHQ